MSEQTMTADALQAPDANRALLVKNTLVVALAGLLFGYDTGVISGSQMYFTEYFALSPAQQGWAVGSALYGCLLGALMAGAATRRLGRKLTLIISAILFVLSAWGSGAAESLQPLAIYRLIGGLGVGMASMAAPMYIAEISPPALRGRMVSLYQLAVVVGFFVVFLASYYIGGGQTHGMSEAELAALHQENLEQGWRWMLWSELPVAAAFLLLLLTVPESPRWLVMQNQSAKAEKILQQLNGAEQAQREMVEINRDLHVEEGASVWQQLRGPLKIALLVGVALSICQQITGINAILYYGADIFSNALGYGPEDALKQQLWLGAVNLLATFVAIYTVDAWGRKPLLVVGLIGMFIGLVTLALTLMTGTMGVVSLVGVLVFIGAFALSMGPVVWVMLSEIFPNQVRAQALSIAVAAQWLFNALVASAFPVVNGSALNAEMFSGALPYLVFAAFCLLTLWFVWKLVPETRGRSLEQMYQLWHK